jgi:hypothetical protein
MTDLFDMERYDAFEQLLTRPDPPDLPRRSHVLLCAGDPDRHATRLPPIQMVWLQRWCLEASGEDAAWRVNARPNPQHATASEHVAR